MVGLRSRVANCAPLRVFLMLMLLAPAVISVVLLVQITGLQDSKDRFSRCVATWADQYTERAQAVTAVSDPRFDLLIKAFRDALAKKPQAVIVADVKAMLDADTRYKATSSAHPIPSPPKFTCH